MEEEKAALASNLIRLRLSAGITQAELGEKLNYSDKSVSKWERGDGFPDVFVLQKIAAIYHTTVDELLKPYEETEPKLYNRSDEATFSTTAVILVAILGIWTLALLAFILLWMAGNVIWQIFIYAIPISLVTLLVFQSLWHSGHANEYIISALVVSIILTLYLTFLPYNFWQLFLICLPAVGIVFLSYRIRRPKKEKKPKKQKKP